MAKKIIVRLTFGGKWLLANLLHASSSNIKNLFASKTAKFISFSGMGMIMQSGSNRQLAYVMFYLVYFSGRK
jgi:hypothetical protein